MADMAMILGVVAGVLAAGWWLAWRWTIAPTVRRGEDQ